MRRYYLPPDQLAHDPITLTGGAYHYLMRVLRLEPGESVLLCDGAGTEVEAQIAHCHDEEASLTVVGRHQHPAPEIQVRLFQGLPKAASWEWILQKCTELGVAEIVPVICQHSVPRIRSDRASRQQKRWRRIADEAARQSERAYFAKVCPPVTWHAALEMLDPTTLIFCARGDTTALWQILLSAQDSRHVSLLIGPEGGFSPEEIAEAIRRGAHAVSLGDTILRAETAATVAVALTRYALTRDPGR